MMDNTLKILLYHGVTQYKSEGIENYSAKHISADVFYEQMVFVKKNCSVLSIDEVADHYIKKKSLPKNAVSVSFDDGFKNNFTTAAPILKDLNIPAVFYLSTGFIGTEKMFWVDQLEDCINRCKKNTIQIKIDKTYNKYTLKNKLEKISALKSIKDYCKLVTNEEKEIILKQVIKETNIKPNIFFSHNYLKLAWEEVKKMAKNPLFTIGGHSVSHNILAALPKNDMEQEIKESINQLTEKTGNKIVHFSYPEGQLHHYNSQVIEMLKKNGVICCPSSVDGVNTLDDDLFHLKRIMVGFNGRSFPRFN